MDNPSEDSEKKRTESANIKHEQSRPTLLPTTADTEPQTGSSKTIITAGNDHKINCSCGEYEKKGGQSRLHQALPTLKNHLKSMQNLQHNTMQQLFKEDTESSSSITFRVQSGSKQFFFFFFENHFFLFSKKNKQQIQISFLEGKRKKISILVMETVLTTFTQIPEQVETNPSKATSYSTTTS